MKKRKKEKGFSLLELLATLLILSMILGIGGYFVMNAISNSNDKATVLAIDSLKQTAGIYAKEYPDDVVWNTEDGSENSFTCISITTLVNKGYLKESEVASIRENSDYIIMTRNANHVIISEEIDTNNLKCGSLKSGSSKVTIPTAKEYCNNLQYTGLEQTLTKSTANKGFSFSENTGKDAGSYQVTAKLNDGEVWKDDTTEDKTISCTIKKAKVTLSFTSVDDSGNFEDGEIGTELGTKEIAILSNTAGTISLKSSSKDIATASIQDSDVNITANTKKMIQIEKLATRKAPTYITITVNPTDTKNYYSNSLVYTIGEVEKKELEKPTSSNNCSNSSYNAISQDITKNLGVGYLVSGNMQTEIGDYTVKIRPKYGYVWKNSNGSTESVEITCSIQKLSLKVDYEVNKGTSCNSKTVVYKKAYGSLCTTSKTGYTFKKWTDNSNNTITADTIVEKTEAHTLYANWEAKTYKVTMNANGGTNGSYSASWTATYDKTYNLDSYTPTRTGYNFLGWYTAASGGTKVSGNQTWKYVNDVTFYAHWEVKKVTVTFIRNYDSSDNTSKTQTFTYGVSGQSFNSGFSRTGYTALGWSTNRNATSATYSFTSGVADGWINSNSPSITLYAIWKVHVCTITYAPNGGTFNSNASNTVQTMNYGSSTDNMRNANGGTYSATRTGYHINASTAWIRTSDSKTFDETKGYSATDFCPNLGSGNQSVTLNANWAINVCTINFNANGGSFASGVSTVKTLNYGSSWTNLWNVLGSSSHFNSTAPSGYTKIKAARAWMNNSSKAKYSQASDVTYNATDFCPSLASGNQTITLYANWYRRQKKTYNSCKTGSNTCKAGYICQAGYKNDCITGVYRNKTQCQKIEGSNATWSNGSCCRSVYSSCATSYYSSCKTGSNTCKGGWNSWTTVNSCTATSTRQCRDNFKLTQ